MSVGDLLSSKRVLVVCGAGGVGKTTTSASLALAAARAGRRVLVITIDPSKRLAQTLGVSANEEVPRALPDERQRAVGVEGGGNLSAWMLDPQAVADRTVRRLAGSGAEELLGNRIYRNVTSMLAGMQEYAAVEALHGFVTDDAYDLVVLDTPPSRDALRFLDAPARALRFFDPRVLRLFVPDSKNPIRVAATITLERLLDLGFGEQARREVQSFFRLFEGVLDYLTRNQESMQRFLSGDDVGFLLVSSSSAEALEEARYFGERARELGLPVSGTLLNRSLAFAQDRAMPADVMDDDPDPILKSALAKLGALAEVERDRAHADAALIGALRAEPGSGRVAALRELPSGASDLEALVALAEELGSLPDA